MHQNFEQDKARSLKADLATSNNVIQPPRPRGLALGARGDPQLYPRGAAHKAVNVDAVRFDAQVHGSRPLDER